MKTQNCIKSILLLGFVFLFLFPVISMAQQYPTRSITVTVVSNPGGGIDLCVRAITDAMRKTLGQALVIENNFAGSGIGAFTQTAKAQPDGYHLLGSSTSGFIWLPHLRNVPYNVQDIIPIAVFAHTPNKGVFVRGDAPWKTFKELVTYAKNNPGKLTYSHGGIGSVHHVGLEAVTVKEGIKWTGIPYKSTPETAAALLGGHVDFASAGIYEQEDQFRAGKLRLLAVTDSYRCALAPEVPTLREMGYGYSADIDMVLSAPKGTPPAIIQKLGDAVKEGTKDPQFIKAMENLRNGIVFMGPQEAKKYLDAAYVEKGKLIKDLKIPVEN
jgi:tripartite-type tricarboxylate transporter receptor subunit TctC